jgi:proteasome lid subunit RPN8/RPN11
MFELPKGYKGLEEVMHDVRATAADKGIERCIGLVPDGHRVFDVLGEDARVQCPDWATGTPGLFIVHGHPSNPCELSQADMECIHGLDAVGNMAVCSSDETVSWSHGLYLDHITTLPEFLQTVLIRDFMHTTEGYVLKRMGAKEGEGNATWPMDDERWVALAHFNNKLCLERGFFRDYQVRLGDKAQAIIDKWTPIVGDITHDRR